MNQIIAQHSNPFSFFNAIFCISLEERKDRQAECQLEFEKLGIADRINWYPAVKFSGNHPFVGRAGCLTSHRNCIKIAKAHNLESILIFEDDIQFVNDPIKTLASSIEYLKNNNWNLFYLGQTTTSEIIEKPLQLAGNGILRLFGGLATHSIAYHKSIYDYFLNNTPEPENSINWLLENQSVDGWLMNKIQLSDNFKVYTTDPIVCSQRASFSNVDGKYADYGDNIVKAFYNERSKI